MSDYRTGRVEGKKKQAFNGLFFTFSKPYLDLLARGNIFYLIYFVMAGINLILPFAVFGVAVNAGIFQYGGNYAVAFIFAWVVIAFACWIGMQLWLDRRKKIAALSSTEFIATAVFSELVQTMGEWLGTLLAIIGAGVGLIAAVTLGSDIDQLFRMLGLGFMQAGVLIILVGPVTGFFIIIVSRFLAEQMRLWVSLVNNTGEIAANLQKNLFAERLRVWVSLVNSVKEIAANVKGSANSGRPAAK